MRRPEDEIPQRRPAQPSFLWQHKKKLMFLAGAVVAGVALRREYNAFPSTKDLAAVVANIDNLNESNIATVRNLAASCRNNIKYMMLSLGRAAMGISGTKLDGNFPPMSGVINNVEVHSMNQSATWSLQATGKALYSIARMDKISQYMGSHVFPVISNILEGIKAGVDNSTICDFLRSEQAKKNISAAIPTVDVVEKLVDVAKKGAPKLGF